MSRGAPLGPALATVGAVAAAVGGEAQGDPNLPIDAVAAIDDARPGTITFIRDARHADLWLASGATAALAPRTLELPPHESPARAIVRVDNPDVALVTLLAAVAALADAARRPPAGVHPAACVHPTATVGPGASIGPACTVGPHASIGAGAILLERVSVGHGCTVGDRVVLHPGVVVQHGCSIGENSVLHPGVVVGADGFGYIPSPSGRGLLKVPHVGGVRIGRDVEIGANAAIDRGKIGDTLIGDGAKIDNLVQIGHNCRVGRGVVICGLCGIAGSVEIGDGAQLGGKVGVSDHVRIAPGARIAGGSLVSGDVDADEPYIGVPARPRSRFKKDLAAALAVPRLKRRLDEALQRIARLEARDAEDRA